MDGGYTSARAETGGGGGGNAHGGTKRLAALVESGGFDLLAVGHRGRGAVQRALLGSVADRLAQISRKPVLIWRG